MWTILYSCPGNFYPRSPCGERLPSKISGNQHKHFYPRSPCGERLLTTIITICIVPFLSTLSLRRATSSIDDLEPSTTHFYPRSPCGERHTSGATHRILRAFLSTLSLRRATVGQNRLRQKLAISIHALLAESDHPVSVLVGVVENFYPRSPCGERPLCRAIGFSA